MKTTMTLDEIGEGRLTGSLHGRSIFWATLLNIQFLFVFLHVPAGERERVSYEKSLPEKIHPPKRAKI